MIRHQHVDNKINNDNYVTVTLVQFDIELMSLVGTMYDMLLEQDAWCYWVISIAVILSLVGFILACICSCRHNDNK